MENKKKVAILMATYNGEKYIREQILSLRNQSYINWKLFIADNGSTDSTLSIIEQQKNEDSRIELPIINREYRGAFMNYYFLLKFAQEILVNEFDYFALCDQDDIWREDRISNGIEVLSAEMDDKPLLTYSDLELINGDGKEEGKKISDLYDINLTNSYNIFFNQVYVWGNTVTFNRRLLSMLNIRYDIDPDFSHDQFLALYSTTYGKTLYIDKPLVKYRRFVNNASDIVPNNSIKNIIFKMQFGIKNVIYKHAHTYTKILYFIDIAPNTNVILQNVKRAYMSGGVCALKIIKRYKIKAGPDKMGEIINLVILFTKIYKKTSIFQNFKNGKE